MVSRLGSIGLPRSGLVQRFFRRQAERHAGMIPNTIGASRSWQLDCEGLVFAFVKGNLSGAEGAAASGQRGAGKGGRPNSAPDIDG